MYLKRLKLVNFRNYRQQLFAFDPQINFIIGGNAQGKTNLLEAIFYLSAGCSYRTKRDKEVARWNSEGFFIEAEIKNKEKILSVELLYRAGGEQKTASVNGQKYSSSILFTVVPVVLFVPEDLDLIKKGPPHRRKFLNTEISRLRPSYYQCLQQYNRALEQRNRLLKYRHGSAALGEVESWNKPLADLGSRIIYQRLQNLYRLNDLARRIHRSLTRGAEDLLVIYNSTVVKEGRSLEELKEIFCSKLERVRSAEQKKGYTLIGPQRDDISIMINGREARRYASQGQQRTAVLSLKLAELTLFMEEKEYKPLLLLDDVFSELDEKRRQFFIDFLTDRVQVFITSTRLGKLERKYALPDRVFVIKGGKLEDGPPRTDY